MRVLVVGGGGREHAICAKLIESDKVSKLFCLPGNAGILKIAETVDISVMDFKSIVDFSIKNKIDLCFVAPDDPLSGGLVDILMENNIMAFGPSKAAAIIEGSKSFSKDFMKRHNIPTASYEVFSEYDQALSYIKDAEYPLVVKADGLALGKGVIICHDYDCAKAALDDMMLLKAFGNAGNKVVIEEFMEGKEVSLLAFTDGVNYSLMPSSQDHKKVYDNDEGLNTGGMGAFTPSVAFNEDIRIETIKKVVIPTIDGMRAEGRLFKGVIYFGLMLTKKGIRVLEYNARFGDPETQAVLPLLKTDFIDIILAIINGKLDTIDIEWEDKAAICVILASGGYPKDYKKCIDINIGDIDYNVSLYHSGTKIVDNQLVTNGGRVIGVVAKGDTIDMARQVVYNNIKKIHFNGMHYRTDIGIKL